MTVGAMLPGREDSAAAAESTTGGRVNWLPLLVVAALLGLIAWWNWKGLIVVAMLLVSIVLHELGHFLGARWAGMRATEFFVGMGPAWSKIWSIRRGETEYGIKAFLVGGYVKTPGLTNLEEIAEEHEARSYRAAPFGKRFRHVIAGPLTNLLLGLLSFVVLFAAVDEPRAEPNVIRVGYTDRGSGEIIKDSAIRDAGVIEGDVIVAFDGRPLPSRDAYKAYIQARPGTPIDVTVRRDGQEQVIRATPARFDDECRKGTVGKFGAYLDLVEDAPIHRNVAEAAQRGTAEFGRQVGGTVVGIGKVFGPEGLGKLFRTVTGDECDDGQRASSVVGIAKFGAQNLDSPSSALALFGGLNIALGLFNLLPLPPFDGGHLVIALYERIQQRRRGLKYRVDFAKVMPYFAPFLAIILFVVTSAIYLDVKR